MSNKIGWSRKGPKWRWLVPGVLLAGFTVLSLPGAINVVKTPDRWHGFEVDWNWYFIYASPVLFAASALMIYAGLVPPGTPPDDRP
jgi:hypothetical protein